MTATYFELRPAYTGVANYYLTVALCGFGSIVGWTFAGKINDPNGNPLTGMITAVVVDGPNKLIGVTITGQTIPGEYACSIRRTDDNSDFPVAWGKVEVTQVP
jgi:hypothetical protein